METSISVVQLSFNPFGEFFASHIFREGNSPADSLLANLGLLHTDFGDSIPLLIPKLLLLFHSCSFLSLGPTYTTNPDSVDKASSPDPQVLYSCAEETPFLKDTVLVGLVTSIYNEACSSASVPSKPHYNYCPTI